MKVRVTAEGQTYEFDEEQADNVELMALEKVTGMTIPEWSEAIGRGSLTCITALIWILRRRSEPELAFEDVHFRPASLSVEQVDEGKEVAALPQT